MSRVISRRGLSRGHCSRPFTSLDLLQALEGNLLENVYMELDVEGWLRVSGGVGASGGSVAGAVVRAPLAPHAAPFPPATRPDATPALLLLMGSSHAAARWSLRLATDAPPHAELQLWFDEPVLATLDLPALSLNNILGKEDYVCHECGAGFHEPNPLKVHLFLSCREYTPVEFWKELAVRAEATSALRRVLPWPCLSSGRARVTPDLISSPERLEALAAEWGRSRDGHLCLYCGKLYSRKYGLKIHIRTHTGYKPLRCQYCARAFGDPSNLNKHVRLHSAVVGAAESGAGTHTCSHCGKMLVRRRDLERHLRARHCPAPVPR